MEDTKNLAEALALLQTRLPKVGKAKTAIVETKAGGKYSYQFADLADVSDAVLPLLGAVGLSFSARPTLNVAGTFVLAYTLRHSHGEQDAGEYPLPDPDQVTPQAVGSAITYARRYALCSVTGLAPDQDDDAQAAAAATQRAAQQRPPQAKPAAPPPSECDQIRTKIRELAKARRWNLTTVAQGYAKQYPGRTLKDETDAEPLRLFLADLQSDAAREDEQGKGAA